MSDSIHFRYAVYLLPNSSSRGLDASAMLRDTLPKNNTDLRIVDNIPKDPQAMFVHAFLQKNAKKEFPPPDFDSLQYFGRGIAPDQGKSLQDSNEVLILDFAHPKQHVWTALRTATSLVEGVARKTNGLIWDEETREMFSPDAWHKRRVESWTTDMPRVSSQTTIHAYQKGEFARAITLGMAKFGLPDIVIEDSAWSSNNQVGNIINLFSQSIAEGQEFSKSGRFRLDLKKIKNSEVRDEQLKSLKTNSAEVACLTLEPGKRDDGDPDNRLIRLASDEYPGDDFHAKQERMLSSFFGSEDSVTKIEHNEELLAESAREKAKLPELRKAFVAGLEPGELIALKAPFRTPSGGNEWMWVEVTSWKDDQIKGLLQNDPDDVPALHAGQLVEIKQQDVFDYIRQYPDKRTIGNTTGEIIRKMDESSKSTAAPPVLPHCSPE